MRRTVLLTLVALFGISLAAARSGAPPIRRVRLAAVPVSPSPAKDLAFPEGKTRWDLTGVSPGDSWTRSLEAKEGSVVMSDARAGAKGPVVTRTVYSDPAGGDAAMDWCYPDRDPAQLRMGSRRNLQVDETTADGTDRLQIAIEVVGIGWIHLPSSPHEVVLQRVRLQRERAGSRWAAPAESGYRWVDPRAGVVAEIRGPAAPGTGALLAPDSATILEAVIEGASTLKIHVSEFVSPPLEDITYGWDVPGTCSSTGGVCNLSANCPAMSPPQTCNKSVTTVTTPSYATVGDLIAAGTWDFSIVNSGAEVASTTTPINSAETCNYNQCGYTTPGAYLERTDKSFNVPATLYKVNDAAQQENRASDVTIWLRAGSQNEGVSGGLGSGESGFCYITFGGVTRTPVPLWQFTHLDAGSTDYYTQAGDSWQGGPFNCEQNLFNQVCGGGGLFSKLYTKGCTSGSTGTHAGTQSVTMIKGGVVTLPSGHTFNALLAKNVADFCVFLGSSCLSASDTVRTVNYLWQVPYLGTVVRIQSPQNAPVDLVSFSTLTETDIHFGLFPPVSISVSGTTSTSVSLSWNPGNDTHRITDYRVYWDTDPGAVSPYAFDSVNNPSQVSFAGTSATISGLTPGTTYYFTVTSRSTFTDPSSGIVTTYESIRYPTQVSGDPSFIYPVEVQATPPCPATAEVTGLTVNTTANPGEVQICWNPVTDACLTGYQVLYANTPPIPYTDGFWGPLASTGITNCWTGTPPYSDLTYFLVIATGFTGNGPWGHYGH
jgi:fibronectin type III domain protein